MKIYVVLGYTEESLFAEGSPWVVGVFFDKEKAGVKAKDLQAEQERLEEERERADGELCIKFGLSPNYGGCSGDWQNRLPPGQRDQAWAERYQLQDWMEKQMRQLDPQYCYFAHYKVEEAQLSGEDKLTEENMKFRLTLEAIMKNPVWEIYNENWDEDYFYCLRCKEKIELAGWALEGQVTASNIDVIEKIRKQLKKEVK
jgi:hypothetical protein